MIEERCECGYPIPKGYGYYNYCKPVKCFGCGRINRRDKPESPEELGKKLSRTIRGQK